MRHPAVFFIASCLAVGCGADASQEAATDAGLAADTKPDLSAPLFDPTQVVEVSITMKAEDWDFIRTQTRDLSANSGDKCMSGPFLSPFVYKPATVTVNGQTLANVGVRKKGFLGSLDDTKPSLKIKFDKFTVGQELFGLERLTLNNDKSDPSHVRQCLAYGVFAAAGVPAPRCNVAHVTVNGQDLGVFTHLESIKKRFIARHFADKKGRLFEGTLSDFCDKWLNTFEGKTDDPDRSALLAMKTALEAPDDGLEAALAPLVDLAQFARFWAAEVLVQHGDGYAGNMNNFYLYEDPTDGRLHFIPWGVDNTFSTFSKGMSADAPKILRAKGMLTRRLYLHPPTRAKYLAAMAELLADVWHEDALLAEVERVEQLVAPLSKGDPFHMSGKKADPALAAADVRAWIKARRAAVQAELDAPPAWNEPLAEPFCFGDKGGDPGKNCQEDCLKAGGAKADCDKKCVGLDAALVCYEACVAKGDAPAACKAACSAPVDPKKCVEDCVKGGRTPAYCEMKC